MPKLMRDKKKFGRCSVPGHGSTCELSHELQSIASGRHDERREIAQEVDRGLDELLDQEEEPLQ